MPLRIAVVWNIPIACNRASADFMISSRLMDAAHERLLPNYEGYRCGFRNARMAEACQYPLSAQRFLGGDWTALGHFAKRGGSMRALPIGVIGLHLC
jgi:hypothetical protein